MAELPSGTVTFLFTDLEGSTRLWEEFPDAMRPALARHDEILRGAIADHDGAIVKTTGDGVHAAFAVALDGLDAAIAAQLALDGHEWGATGPLRVRMGLHTGAAEVRDGDYYGTAVNRAARVMSVAHGGQVIVTRATHELVRDGSYELVDLGEHRLRDLGEPEQMFQVNHPELAHDFPRLRSVDAYPTNLPVQTTSFVGRDDDIADAAKALEDARVFTLTGVGGVGKTRLAVQTAAEILPRFRDGAWLCELGPLTDPAGLPDVLAAALRVQPRQGMSTAESIVDALKEKQLLIVLDNCEHLITAAARMVDAIVRACPEVRVLATSREGLGVRGERIASVRSLELPLEGSSVEALATSEAVRLFADRSLEAGGGFRLDGDNAAAVVALCNRLDGIPLALELAAARTRMMTPAEIAARLDERFRLLTGGSRTAVERHQTLRQAVDWSYDLLDPREQTILNRLGVFAGGFTLDAAEAVAAGVDVEAFDVLDGVAHLVDKSLVVAEHQGEGTRYRLLETIRHYALERLDDAGETDTVRRRHAEWCVDFATRTNAGMRSPDEVVWTTRLERECDNIRAGVTWAAGVDDADLAIRQIGALTVWSLVHRTIGYRLAPLADIALGASGALDHPHAPRVLAIRCADHLHHARAEAGERDAREGIRLVREGHAEPSFEPWSGLYNVLVFSTRTEDFAAEVDGFVAAGLATGDPFDEVAVDTCMAGWLFTLNRGDESLEHGERALVLARQLRNPSLTMYSAFGLGGALLRRDPDRARALLLEAVDLGRQVETDFWVGLALGRLVRIDAGALDGAWARRYRDAIDLGADNGDRRNVAVLVGILGEALWANGRGQPAAVLLGYMSAWGEHIGGPFVLAHYGRIAAELTEALGEELYRELSARGAAMEFAEVVALARAELDRVIVADVSTETP